MTALALAAALVAAPVPPARPEVVTLPLRAEPYDADTLRARLPGDRGPLADVLIRLEGIDTPELGWRAACPAELAAAATARVWLIGRLDGVASVTVIDPRWGKYGGRVLGRVFAGGHDRAAELIARGHARPYDGGKRKDWCDG